MSTATIVLTRPVTVSARRRAQQDLEIAEAELDHHRLFFGIEPAHDADRIARTRLVCVRDRKSAVLRCLERDAEEEGTVRIYIYGGYPIRRALEARGYGRIDSGWIYYAGKTAWRLPDGHTALREEAQALRELGVRLAERQIGVAAQAGEALEIGCPSALNLGAGRHALPEEEHARRLAAIRSRIERDTAARGEARQRAREREQRAADLIIGLGTLLGVERVGCEGLILHHERGKALATDGDGEIIVYEVAGEAVSSTTAAAEALARLAASAPAHSPRPVKVTTP